ncbi:hypothetical protein PsorP6_013224 [Peronosclerospora sorghi]|uniref:Uncharacterized protein n=1 Tax=Peronosclerospora sorghi TaxID=230839 RepID=A0ACC0WGL5_9STRA|nr:hypothetical protein PsorP6_013224 [Peronosclerospora sorghi]
MTGERKKKVNKWQKLFLLRLFYQADNRFCWYVDSHTFVLYSLQYEMHGKKHTYNEGNALDSISMLQYMVHNRVATDRNTFFQRDI